MPNLKRSIKIYEKVKEEKQLMIDSETESKELPKNILNYSNRGIRKR